MNRVKKALYLLPLIVTFITSPVKVIAQDNIDTVDVFNVDPNFGQLQNFTPDMYVSTAINLILGVAGVASFVFLVWGGLQWIQAGGDKDATDKARKKVTEALIGLAIVFSAYAIIFILRTVFHIQIIGFPLEALNS